MFKWRAYAELFTIFHYEYVYISHCMVMPELLFYIVDTGQLFKRGAFFNYYFFQADFYNTSLTACFLIECIFTTDCLFSGWPCVVGAQDKDRVQCGNWCPGPAVWPWTNTGDRRWRSRALDRREATDPAHERFLCESYRRHDSAWGS